MGNKVSYIIQLKDKFSQTGEKINRKFRDIELNARKTTRALKEQEKQWEGLRARAKRFGAAGAAATAAVTVPMALMAKSMVNAASDAKEVSDKFDEVFKSVAPKANKAAMEFAKTFKLADSTAQNMLSSTGDLLTGFGFTDDKALGLSQTINKMALDLAAFQNLEGGAPRASKALTSALSGETEGLKALGIVVNQNDPAFKKLLKTNMRAARGDLVRAKALTILKIAQDQSRKSVDNYLNTIDTYAGQQRIAQEANKQMRESFGKLLLPMAIKITQAITKLTGWINNLSPSMKNLVLVLGGVAAVAGPLLLLIAGMTAAFTVLSLPVLAVSAAVLGIGAAITYVALQWDSIVAGMQQKWESFKASFGSLGGKLLSFVGVANGAPATPVKGANSTVSGEIKVSAAEGSKVESTSLQNKGLGLNLGMNMVAG